MNRIISSAMVLILIGFVSLGVHTAANTSEHMEIQKVRLNSTIRQIHTLEIKNQELHNELDTELKSNDVDQQKVKDLEKQIEDSDRAYRELQEAKAEQKRKDEENATLASKALNAVTGTSTAYADGTHDKYGIMSEAGIASSDYAAVDYIISHESGWNSNAINAGSGACGLGQEWPCGKSGCTLGDSVCQMRWASNYAVSRYGSWWGAYSYWQQNHWW